MSDFWEQYRRPEWQRKRLEVMTAADYRCELCDAADKTLNVHHKIYIKGRKPWEYEREQLECLCESCHEKTHGLRDELKHLIGALPLHKFEMLLGYAKALAIEEEPSATAKIGSFEQAIGVGHAFCFADQSSAPLWILGLLANDGTVFGYDLMNLWAEKHGAEVK